MKYLINIILFVWVFSAGAQSFERIPLHVTGTMWPTCFKKGMLFVHSRTLSNTGEDSIFVTTDSGRHWRHWICTAPVDHPRIFYGNIHSIDFSDTLNIYVAYLDSKGDVLLHTMDGGKTWSKHLNLRGRDAGFGRLYFINDSVGYMQDWGRYLYKTRDWGNHWEFLSDLGSGTGINRLISIDTSVSYFNGYPGFICRINNGYSSFTLWQSELQYSGFYEGLDVMNYDTVWATANDMGRGDSSIVNYTFDGGKTWQNRHFAPGTYWQNIHFTDNKHGYMVGYKSDYWNTWFIPLFAQTDNFGESWTIKTLPYNVSLTDIVFVNDSIAYITGDSGLLLRMNTHGTDTLTTVIAPAGPQSTISLYPNPAQNIITLQYTIPQKENVSIALYDIMGRKLADVIPISDVSAGTYKVKYNSQNLSPGAYFFRLQAGSQTVTEKFIKIRQ